MNIIEYSDFLIFAGLLGLTGIVLRFFLAKRLKKFYISEREVAKLQTVEKNSTLEVPVPKISLIKALLIIIIGGFILNQLLIIKLSSTGIFGKLFNINISITKK